MRNILAEAPATELHGVHLRASRFVADYIAGRDVLDIGCGYGWFELFALSRGVRSITGIEVSAADLETAKGHIDSPAVRFEVASAISLPFAEGSFDTVVCWEVLEHLPPRTEQKAFAEIRRVLRPDGTLYLSTPHASISAQVLDPAWWLIGHRHYSLPTLRRFAESAGLTVEVLEVRGGRWLTASILDMYIAKWIFRRPPFLANYVNRKVDHEMAASTGWADCFMKCGLAAAV
jgi:SAM-dependent methyltransferase